MPPGGGSRLLRSLPFCPKLALVSKKNSRERSESEAESRCGSKLDASSADLNIQYKVGKNSKSILRQENHCGWFPERSVLG